MSPELRIHLWPNSPCVPFPLYPFYPFARKVSWTGLAGLRSVSRPGPCQGFVQDMSIGFLSPLGFLSLFWFTTTLLMSSWPNGCRCFPPSTFFGGRCSVPLYRCFSGPSSPDLFPILMWLITSFLCPFSVVLLKCPPWNSFRCSPPSFPFLPPIGKDYYYDSLGLFHFPFSRSSPPPFFVHNPPGSSTTASIPLCPSRFIDPDALSAC